MSKNVRRLTVTAIAAAATAAALIAAAQANAGVTAGKPAAARNDVRVAASGVADGFASVGVGTTGGSGGTVVTVTTAAQLNAAAAKAGKAVIKVQGTITGASNVRVSSDKTIVGVGANAGLDGGSLVLKAVHNVVIQNLKIKPPKAPADAVHLEKSDHVWIDHNEFFSTLAGSKDAFDGLVDITHASDFVTVSFNNFHDHHKVSLVGHSDSNAKEDTGKLHVTYHHNIFRNVGSRLPSLRFGTGHVFDNVFQDVQVSGVHSRMGAQLLVQNNVFRNAGKKAVFTKGDSKQDGFMVESGNDFGGVTAPALSKGTFTKAPYAVTLTPTAQVLATVTSQAGVGKIG